MGEGRRLSKDDRKQFLIDEYPGVAVRAGFIDGLTGFRKFGTNSDIDSGTTPETVWSTGGLYPWASHTGTTQVEVVSTNANDTSAGTGARTVRLIGLAGDNWEQRVEEVTMNGTTAVTTTRTDWRRIDRAIVVTAGTALRNLGAITIRRVSAGATFCQIPANDNQTSLAVLTIPGDMFGAILSLEVAVIGGNNNANVLFGLYTRNNSADGVSGLFRLRAESGTRASGTTSFERVFRMPIILDPRTDVEVRVLSAGANDVFVESTFEIIAADTTIFDPALPNL